MDPVDAALLDKRLCMFSVLPRLLGQIHKRSQHRQSADHADDAGQVRKCHGVPLNVVSMQATIPDDATGMVEFDASVGGILRERGVKITAATS